MPTDLGVEIYPGFAAAEVLRDENGAVRGVATGDMGIGRDGQPKDSFTRGMELRGKYTLIAEGAHGSLTKQLIRDFRLARRPRTAEIRHRHQGVVAGHAGEPQARHSCSTRWAGRSTTAPAAARSCITMATIWSRSVSWCI